MFKRILTHRKAADIKLQPFSKIQPWTGWCISGAGKVECNFNICFDHLYVPFRLFAFIYICILMLLRLYCGLTINLWTVCIRYIAYEKYQFYIKFVITKLISRFKFSLIFNY